MNRSPDQLNLFDTDKEARQARAETARAQMRKMIENLTAATWPPWKDMMAQILDDGVFVRAMQLVPDDEGKALWAEYDAQAHRLCALYPGAEPAPDPEHPE